MMTQQQIAIAGTALAITLTLMACGSGSDGTSGSLSSSSTTTTSQGVITGFGSVFVNGVEYYIGNNTAISVNGRDRSESDLQLGMLVTVKGTVNPDGKIGMANEITYANQVNGVVTANTVSSDGTGTLTVMGQTVTVTADTVFDSNVAGITSPDLIQVGNIVEISGYASNTGDITATRIEVKASSQTAVAMIEVKGVISNLDTTTSTFTIGALTVDYSGLSAANLPSVALADGLYVEVKSTTTFDGTGPLVASAIYLEDDGFKGHDGHEGEGLEVWGLVTADYANGQFEVNGRTVQVDANTLLVNGTTDQLLTGNQIKVRTHYDANGNLVADRIEFKFTTAYEFQGTLQAVDTTAGTVTVLGKTIYVNSSTLMMDKSSDAMRYFSLTDLDPNNSDYLEVHAYKDAATGNLIATKLERESYSSQSKLIGPVQAVNSLVVADVPVDTSTAGIIPTLNVGQTVMIIGSYSNDTLTATKLSVVQPLASEHGFETYHDNHFDEHMS
ncbi:MAG: DUF5666 domain-containing protein [Gammaproteobacteria bacterium]